MGGAELCMQRGGTSGSRSAQRANLLFCFLFLSFFLVFFLFFAQQHQASLSARAALTEVHAICVCVCMCVVMLIRMHARGPLFLGRPLRPVASSLAVAAPFLLLLSLAVASRAQ